MRYLLMFFILISTTVYAEQKEWKKEDQNNNPPVVVDKDTLIVEENYGKGPLDMKAARKNSTDLFIPGNRIVKVTTNEKMLVPVAVMNASGEVDYFNWVWNGQYCVDIIQITEMEYIKDKCIIKLKNGQKVEYPDSSITVYATPWRE